VLQELGSDSEPNAVPLFQLSELAEQIIVAAREVAREHDVAFPALTTSELLIGATRVEEAVEPTSPFFLRQFIVTADRQRYESVVKDWMDFYQRGGAGNYPAYTNPSPPFSNEHDSSPNRRATLLRSPRAISSGR